MFKIFKTILDHQNSCLIIPHQSPDGDCLGSSFALSHFFDQNKCTNHILMDDTIPTNYLFLEKENMIRSMDVLDNNFMYDYIIILDTSSKDRVGALPEVLTYGKQIIVIDHHKTNAYFGDHNIVDMISSVGEILYNMMIDLNYAFDAEIAIGLYTSIITDTGEFRYSNTTPEAIRAVANLFETGFDFEQVNRNIFSNQPLSKVKLKSEALSNLKLYHNNQVAIMSVTQEMLNRLKCEMFHSDGIVEAGRDIEGVEVSVLLKEMNPGNIKVSLRSKSFVDVSEVSLIFGGGGHVRAAGCTVNDHLNAVEEKIAKLLGERLS
ncbi:MAG: bifunctional oligoribonuclease/PAP phosphatase NrnA [Clostridia bacterium]|nr:bifunctional oligoribonuclease/PAP phosphatase NrnA [Clostridia bacterium]